MVFSEFLFWPFPAETAVTVVLANRSFIGDGLKLLNQFIKSNTVSYKLVSYKKKF